jgi:hypothetical protein
VGLRRAVVETAEGGSVIFKMDPKEEAMFQDLRKRHLRHPGTVGAKIVKILRLSEVNEKQFNDVRLEWLKLGFGREK